MYLFNEDEKMHKCVLLSVLVLGVLSVEMTVAARTPPGFASRGCWLETHLQTRSSVMLQVGGSRSVPVNKPLIH